MLFAKSDTQPSRYFGRIQDKDDDYYLQFNLVICGLDSVEARRWMNATLVGLVDPENPESLKPMIDGGTEGLYLYFFTLTTSPDDCCRV
jgi:ubiquitin-activating enzyme E1 C